MSDTPETTEATTVVATEVATEVKKEVVGAELMLFAAAKYHAHCFGSGSCHGFQHVCVTAKLNDEVGLWMPG